ncbi:MAG: DUF1521 domain-containing protein [Dokdonella sp.]
MSIFNGAAASGGNQFFENVQFRHEISQSLNQADSSIGSVRIRAALDGVDMNRLSSTEKNVLLANLDVLAQDGAISGADADAMLSLISQFESTGQLLDSLLGGNIGNLSGGRSLLPFNAGSLAAYPGSALFGHMLGGVVEQVVQTFKDSLFSASATSMLDSCKSTYGADKVAHALDNADLSKLNPAERAKVLSMIGFAAADGRIGLVDARAICNYLDQAQGKCSPCSANGWPVVETGEGRASIDLGNYTLDVNESNSEFVVTNKESGEKTRIWGDPHFDHNGARVGDFYGTTTLNLADGTKITINTTPYLKGGDGTTLSSTLTITQGDRVMRITGLDQNTLGDLKIEQLGFTGRLVDAAVDDGTSIYENPEGGPWLRLNDGGWMQAIDRNFLAQIV